MLLLTGATGSIGSRLLPLLLERGEDVRCLVRDPRRLGPRRVDVQIALGDLGDLADPHTVRQSPARRRHRRPPGGDDPRPAAAPARGAERPGDGAPAAGGRAGRGAALRLLQRARRGRRPAHPLLPRQVGGGAGGRVLAAGDLRLRPLDRLRPLATPGSPSCAASPSCRCCRCPGRGGRPSSRSGRRTSPSAWSRRWRGEELRAALRAGRAGDAHLRRDVGPGQPHRRAPARPRPRAAAPDQGEPRRRSASSSARPCLQPGRRPS